MFIDIHTHADGTNEDQLAVHSIDLLAAQALGESFSFSKYVSIGLHPWWAEQWNMDLQLKLESVLLQTNVVFLGEIGIDNLCGVPLNLQKDVYFAQLEIASNVRKPVLIHMVRSLETICASKKQFPSIPAWIVHGFRGKPREVLRLVDLGFYLSFGMGFNHQSVACCPIESLFLETDDSNIDLNNLYMEVANIKGVSVSLLEQQVKRNFFAICTK